MQKVFILINQDNTLLSRISLYPHIPPKILFGGRGGMHVKLHALKYKSLHLRLSLEVRENAKKKTK